MILVTLFISSTVALTITFLLYIKQGLPTFSMEIFTALFDIFSFWFLLAVNFAIPLALFINSKYLFKVCINGFSLQLLSCPKEGKSEIIPEIGYGDLVQVWRKLFFLTIWITAVFMIMAISYFYLFTSYESLFAWFSIYLLYFFILLSGYPSIVLLASRCKRARIVTC